MKIAHYKTVRGQDPKQLDDLVNAAISEGFQPYGSPYVIGEWTCQAMTQLEDVPKTRARFGHNPHSN